MPLEDLEIEFEDEDEDESKKKKDALHLDVDLEFSTDESVKPRSASAKTALQAAGTTVAETNPNINHGPAVSTNPRIQSPQKLNPAATVAKVTALPQRQTAPVAKANPSTPSSQPKVQGSLALADQVFSEDVNEELLELREKVQKLEVDSQIKVRVAEFKAEIMSDVLSDIKLMDHQITQILSRINAKHPDAKNEVMMIKKLLTDFVAKRRK
ncbi:MAG: hypothetical protein ACOVP4_10630 [Bacteriovoracaceae bacterium]